MNRRSFIVSSTAIGLSPLSFLGGCTSLAGTESGGQAMSSAGVANSTRWTVSPAIGFDACFALVVAAADNSVMQANAHADQRDTFRAMLGAEGITAAERLIGALQASGQGSTPGPALARVVSVGKIAALQDVIDTFAIDGLLENGLNQARLFENERARENLQRVRPIATAAFGALKEGGFEEFWKTRDEPRLREASVRLASELAGIDMLAEHRRYLARPLEANVTIYLSELSEPHAMRISGQRMVTSPNLPSITNRRAAVHEAIHTLLDINRPETERILERLNKEPLLKSVARNANAEFGYTSQGEASVRGIVEEGGVQALEAVINARLDQGRDQSAYWLEQDGGMHIFAAATFALMQTTGFAERGGDMLSWMDAKTASGDLQGTSLHDLASSVVGTTAVDRWLD